MTYLYFQDVLNLFKNYKKFLIIGHSLGYLIGYELADILEKNGLSGHIISIDGALPLFQKFTLALLRGQEPNQQNIENMILHQIGHAIVTTLTPEQIQSARKESDSWDDKLNIYMSFVQERNYSDEYLKDIANAMLNRFKMVLSVGASATKKIKSNITLVRPNTNLFQGSDDDYQLDKFTDGNVSTSFVDGSHTTMLDDTKLKQLICDICNKSTNA